jgi:hypothetical protein
MTPFFEDFEIIKHQPGDMWTYEGKPVTATEYTIAWKGRHNGQTYANYMVCDYLAWTDSQTTQLIFDNAVDTFKSLSE